VADREVRYCTAADGTRVAFAVEGSGSGVPTIIAAPPPFPYVRDRQSPIYASESNRATCILDFRGSGLSDRNVKDLSLQALCSDLEAVVDRLGWPRFSLRGMGMSGPIILRYAATHAERVTRLVLQNTYLRASDMGRIPRMRALGAVLRVDWDSYCDLMALTTAGWDDVHASSKAKTWLLQHLTHEETLALADASGSYDVTALAPDIAMPTLVANPDFMAA
jgi:pimeloyl-ACP methyl ester carboxylesterase